MTDGATGHVPRATAWIAAASAIVGSVVVAGGIVMSYGATIATIQVQGQQRETHLAVTDARVTRLEDRYEALTSQLAQIRQDTALTAQIVQGIASNVRDLAHAARTPLDFGQDPTSGMGDHR